MNTRIWQATCAGLLAAGMAAVGCAGGGKVKAGAGTGTEDQTGVESIERVPATVQEFAALRAQKATRPEGAAAMMVAAMLAYTEDPARGTACATMLLTPEQRRAGTAWEGTEPGQTFGMFLGQLARQPGIARSLVSGTKPANDYRLPAGALKVKWRINKHSKTGPESLKMFVACSGADTPRPITLRRNAQGLWEVQEASSLFVGVRRK